MGGDFQYEGQKNGTAIRFDTLYIHYIHVFSDSKLVSTDEVDNFECSPGAFRW